MSVWEKVFKNPKSKVVLALGPETLSVQDIKLPKRNYQLPSLYLGLALGTTFTKRTFLCQLGTEVMRWTPENQQSKSDLSVFRIEKVHSDREQEISFGEEALSNFMSDRGDPSCTLFFQPGRFLLTGGKMPSFVTSYEGQKILHQSPANEEIYQYFVHSQFEFLWKKAHAFFSDIRRFQIGQIVVEYPDYFATPDLKKYRRLLVDAAKKFFPPTLSMEEEYVDVSEKMVLMPEAVITFLHWLTDQFDPKLAAQDLDLKRMLVRY
jgi:hypothetical protein